MAAPSEQGFCPRCGARLHRRHPDSIQRSWALGVAAAVCFVPANVLPVMVTDALGSSTPDTILGGVVFLYGSGSWPLEEPDAVIPRYRPPDALRAFLEAL